MSGTDKVGSDFSVEVAVEDLREKVEALTSLTQKLEGHLISIEALLEEALTYLNQTKEKQ